MTLGKAFFLIFVSFTVTRCSDPTQAEKEIIITSQGKWQKSTTAGNLMATAIRHQHRLDVVLYPSAFLADDRISIIKMGMSPLEIDNVLALYPDDINDQFLIGSMKGKSIRRFLFRQAESTYRAEVQVAGLRYDYGFVGGLNTVNSVMRRNYINLDDDTVYRLAISNSFFFSGKTAPGYLFGYGFNFDFRRFQEGFISAKEALSSYLKNMSELPNIKYPRARVKISQDEDVGFKTIPEIQGIKHLSPYRGKSVKTKGVITAVGYLDKYPGGFEIYIQDPEGDGDEVTSDAIFIYLKETPLSLQVGDEILVSGVVHEDRFPSGDNFADGLTRTAIRQISDLQVLSKDHPLPPSTRLGEGGRDIPNHFISTYNSNLNDDRKTLKMTDGIDFWESLESMRIQITNPKVVGFSGGKDKLQDKGPKSFLNLFVRPDGHTPDVSETPAGGLIIDEPTNDYNPNILSIWTHHLNRGLDPQDIFKVGEIIDGVVDGLLVYEKNFFNDGHYAFLLPNKQNSFLNWKKNRLKSASEKAKNLELSSSSSKKPFTAEELITVPFSLRPATKILPQGRQLTVATYNLENLSNKDFFRMKEIGLSIKENMKCPDIVNLVEIQDFNGINVSGGSSAQATLESLVGFIPCNPQQDNVNYEIINIDPYPNSEGGQPGGNIRVSMIYNSLRVGFLSNPNLNPLAETLINPKTGNLSHNPGRVFPNDDAFSGSRKSIVAEFTFHNQRIVVIGNHFNSKLGDASLWGATQPPILKSIKSRTKMADKINDFVEALQKADPNVNVIVAGDFNAHLTERAMRSLEGNDLKNLIIYKDLVAPNDRYTTNHNGNSQGLDYILANKNLLSKQPKIDILHVNSDYMSKHSDHDPLVAGFTF